MPPIPPSPTWILLASSGGLCSCAKFIAVFFHAGCHVTGTWCSRLSLVSKKIANLNTTDFSDVSESRQGSDLSIPVFTNAIRRYYRLIQRVFNSFLPFSQFQISTRCVRQHWITTSLCHQLRAPKWRRENSFTSRYGNRVRKKIQGPTFVIFMSG